MPKGKPIDSSLFPVGKKFGKLTVSSKVRVSVGEAGRKQTVADFVCECGTRKALPLSRVMRGAAQSCGCLKKESRKENRIPTEQLLKRAIFRQYKQGASVRGMQFLLPEEKFFQMILMPCHYCGSPPSNVRRMRRYEDYYIYGGIDRKQNDLGYTEENCVPCCKTCNLLKKAMPYSVFVNHVAAIARNFSGTPSTDFGDIVERLAVANIKLYMVCEEKERLSKMKPSSKEEASRLSEKMRIAMEQDVALCRLRGRLKNMLNQAVGGPFDVKNYGGNG